MGKIRKILGFLAILFTVLHVGSALAAGYTCNTKKYTSCNKNYYLKDNQCLSCPSGYPYSDGGTGGITSCYSATKSRAWTGAQNNGSTPAGCASVTAWNSCSNPACNYVAYSNDKGDGDGTIKSGCSTNSAACTKTAKTVTANANYYANSTTDGSAATCPACSTVSNGTYPKSDGGSITSAYCYKDGTKTGNQVNGSTPTGCASVTEWNACTPGTCTYKDYYTATDTNCTPTDCTKTAKTVTANANYYANSTTDGSAATCPACNTVGDKSYTKSDGGSITSAYCYKDGTQTGLQVDPTKPANCATMSLGTCTPGTCTYKDYYTAPDTTCAPTNCTKPITALTANANYYVNGTTSCPACSTVGNGTYTKSDGGNATSAYCYKDGTKTGSQVDPTKPTGCATMSLGTCSPGTCTYKDYYTATDGTCTPTNCTKPITALTANSGNYVNGTTSCPACSTVGDGSYTKSDGGNATSAYCYKDGTKTGNQVNGSTPSGCASVTAWNACTPGTCTYKDYYTATDTNCTPTDCTKTAKTVTANANYYANSTTNGSAATCPACNTVGDGSYTKSDGGSITNAYCYKDGTKTGSQVDPTKPTGCATMSLGTCSPGTCTYKDYYSATDTNCTPTNCTKPITALTANSGNYVNGTTSCPACSTVGDGSYTKSDGGNATSAYCYKDGTKTGSQVNGSTPTGCASVTAWNACTPGTCTYKDYYSATDTDCTPSNCTKTAKTVTANANYYANSTTNGSAATCPACSTVGDGSYTKSDGGSITNAYCYKDGTKTGNQVNGKTPDNCASVTAWNACTPGTCTYKDYYTATDTNCTPTDCTKTAKTVTANAGAYVSGASCSLCGAGTFSAGGSATSCIDCTKGSYSSGTGNSSCTACAAGKTTSAAGSTSSSACTTCGNTGAARAKSWSTQTWKSDNTVTGLCTITACNTCSKDSTVQSCTGSSLTGSGSSTACGGFGLTCASGYTSGSCTDPDGVCSCQTGTFTITYTAGSGGEGANQTQSVTYNAKFTTKPSTTFSKANATFVSWQTSSGSGNYPEANKEYTFTSSSDITLTATWKCDPSFKANGTTCEPCGKNKYCPGDGTEQDCPAGFPKSDGSISDAKYCYKEETAQGTQNACSKPTNCATVTCGTCTPGTCTYRVYNGATSGTTNTSCTPTNCTKPVSSVTANAGAYVNGTSCELCAAGTFTASAGSQTSCTKCITGSYNTGTGNSTCTACGPTTNAGKTTSADGKTSCDATCSNSANAATWENASWTNNKVTNLCTIKTCGANYWLDSNTCKKCPDNATCDGTDTVTCNNGYQWNTSTKKCEPRTYQVTLNSNGGTPTATQTITVTYGAAMPTTGFTWPTRTNYNFVGFYDTQATSGGTQYYTSGKASARNWDKTSGATLYARWSLGVKTCTAGQSYSGSACREGYYCPGGQVDADKVNDETEGCERKCPTDKHDTKAVITSPAGAKSYEACTSTREVSDTTGPVFGTADQTCNYDGTEYGGNAACTKKVKKCIGGYYRVSTNDPFCTMVGFGAYSPADDMTKHSCNDDALVGHNNAQTDGQTSSSPEQCFNTCVAKDTADSHGQMEPISPRVYYSSSASRYPACQYNTPDCYTGYQPKGTDACEGKCLDVKLNPNGGSLPDGVSTIYLKYNSGWFSNSACTVQLTSVGIPTWAGHSFGGYMNNTTAVITKEGKFAAGQLTIFKGTESSRELKANWSDKDPVTCNAGTYYSGTGTTCNRCPSGSYCPKGSYVQDTGEAGKMACPDKSKATAAKNAAGSALTVTIASRGAGESTDGGASLETECYATNVDYQTTYGTGKQSCYYNGTTYSTKCTDKEMLTCAAGYYYNKTTLATDCQEAGTGYYSPDKSLDRKMCPDYTVNGNVLTGTTTSSSITECKKTGLTYRPTGGHSTHKRDCYHAAQESAGYIYNCDESRLELCDAGYWDDGNATVRDTAENKTVRDCAAVGNGWFSPADETTRTSCTTLSGAASAICSDSTINKTLCAATGKDNAAAATECYNVCPIKNITGGTQSPNPTNVKFDGSKIAACTYGNADCTTPGYERDSATPTQCTGKCLKISLNHGTGGSSNTSAIYLKYANGWYSNNACTTRLTSVEVPKNTDEYQSFIGYFTSTTSGKLVVNDDGTPSSTTTLYTDNGTAYANWGQVETIACDAGTYYPGTGNTCQDCPSGSYCPGAPKAKKDYGVVYGREECPTDESTYTAAINGDDVTLSVQISSAKKAKTIGECYATNVEHKTNNGRGKQTCYYDDSAETYSKSCKSVEVLSCNEGYYLANKASDVHCSEANVGYYSPNKSLDRTACPELDTASPNVGTDSKTSGSITQCFKKNISYKGTNITMSRTCYHAASTSGGYTEKCKDYMVTACPAGYYWAAGIANKSATVDSTCTEVGQAAYSPADDLERHMCSDLTGADATVTTDGTKSAAATACYNTCAEKEIAGGKLLPNDPTPHYDNGQKKIPACEYSSDCTEGKESNGLTCVNKCIPITLNHNQGKSGTATIWLKYSEGWFSDKDCSKAITVVEKPTRAGGWVFDGYYTGSDTVADKSGTLTEDYALYTEDGVAVARWQETEELECDAGTYYTGAGETCTPCKPGFYCEGTTDKIDSGKESGIEECPKDKSTYTAAQSATGQDLDVVVSSEEGADNINQCYAENVNHSGAIRGTGKRTCYYNGATYTSKCKDIEMITCAAGHYWEQPTEATDCIQVGYGHYSPDVDTKLHTCPDYGTEPNVNTGTETSAALSECFKGNIWYEPAGGHSGHRRTCYHNGVEESGINGYNHNCDITVIVTCDAGYYDDSKTKTSSGERDCAPVGVGYWSPEQAYYVGTEDEKPLQDNPGSSTKRNQCPPDGVTASATAGKRITDCYNACPTLTLQSDTGTKNGVGKPKNAESHYVGTEDEGEYPMCVYDTQCESGWAPESDDWTEDPKCVVCPKGKVCSGGNVESCPPEFPISNEGETDMNNCYRECTTDDVENSTSVTGVVTKGGTNTCKADKCEDGYKREDGVCTLCPAGSVCNDDNEEECPEDHYCPPGSPEPKKCPDSHPKSPAGSAAITDCYTPCESYDIIGGKAVPDHAKENHPTQCKFHCESDEGNSGQLGKNDNGEEMCIETTCKPSMEMKNGKCVACNRDHALGYKPAPADNCTVSSCEDGWRPMGDRCVPEVDECNPAHATSASRKWNSATGTYGPCVIEECEAGYHIEENACVSDTRACAIQNGIGEQEWNAKTGQWGKCVATSCKPGFTNDPYLADEVAIARDGGCANCANKYGIDGEIAASTYTKECDIASCMYQGERYTLDNGECVAICNPYEDETGSMKWNPSTKKCDRTCNPGYIAW